MMKQNGVTVLLTVVVLTSVIGVSPVAGEISTNPSVASPTTQASSTAVLEITPSETAISPGNNTTLSLAVSETAHNVGSYSIKLDVANPLVASIASVHINGSPEVSNVTRTSDGVIIDVAGVNQTAGETLATVTLSGEMSGGTAVQFDTREMTTVRGVSFAISDERDAHLTVTQTTISVSPQNVQAGVDEVTNLSIVAADAGDVGAFEFRFTITDPSVGTIQNVRVGPEEAISDVTVSGNGTVIVSAVGSNISAPGPTVLATIAVATNQSGTTELQLSESTLVSTSGEEIHIGNERNGAISAQAGPPALNEQLERPTDPDGDQLYEDVNGNGRFDIGDVQALLRNYNEIPDEQVSFYDFNGNGKLDIGDVQSLFVEYQTS